jgi:GntR family transcriptional regulator
MSNDLDRNSPLPLYFQLKQILLEGINAGEWKPGGLIPGEHDLEEQYQVSRTVVRQTLSELVNEGYLERHRGRGTFVAQRKVAYDPARRLDLNEYMEQQGVTLDWSLVDHEMVAPPPNVQRALHLNSRDPVMRLRRLRLNGQEVLGYHTAYIARDAANYVDATQFCTGESLLYLFKYPNLNTARTTRIIEATLAESEDLEFMPIKRNSPILHMERLVTHEDGRPIEFLVARFRGDRFKFRMTI